MYILRSGELSKSARFSLADYCENIYSMKSYVNVKETTEIGTFFVNEIPYIADCSL